MISFFVKETQCGYLDEKGNIHYFNNLLGKIDSLNGIQFDDGFVSVTFTEGDLGWVNEAGDILSRGYEYCHDFSEGMAGFCKGEKYGFINTKGEIIADGFDDIDLFHDGYAAIVIGDKKGYIDKEGNILNEDKTKIKRFGFF